MGFDQNDPRPTTVTAGKRTTKVNISMIVAVIVFFVLGGGVIGWIALHPHQNEQSVQQKVDAKRP
jgi:flagellar basal body-associated protein FliL